MMGIVLFAIIGAHLNLGAGYWICFGIGCLFKFIKIVIDIVNELT